MPKSVVAIVLVFAVVGLAAPPARADDDMISAQLEVLPLGSVHYVDRARRDDPIHVSYGITADFEHARNAWLSVGLSPRVVANDETGSAEFDLRVRIRGHGPIAPGLELYGFVSPGYLFVISKADLSGPALVAGVGVTCELPARMFLVGEIGGQVARVASVVEEVRRATVAGSMHLGLGAGTRF